MPVRARDKCHRRERFDLLGVQFVGAVVNHVAHQLICYAVNDKNLFFAYAEDIVVKSPAIYDVSGCFFEVRRFIDYDRRITGSGNNGFSTIAACNARSPRDQQDANTGMREEFVGRLQRWFGTPLTD